VVDDRSTESSGLGNFNEQVWSVFSERGQLAILGQATLSGTDAPLGAVPAATHAAHHFRQALKGRMTHADSDRWCTTPSALRGKRGAVHLPLVWARKLRNRGMVN
jgi:hypothetical protein